ncbi:MAG: DUF2892 domain-containing protein [Rhodobacteraceae bacterium]|nr:DUF2892 domain-containing protein [Paracoccaceae bacterium]
MLKENVGTIDRVVRIAAGALLLVAFYLNHDSPWTWLYVAGAAVLVLTGLVKTCPIYSVLGLSTCPLKK